jgi:trimethylamine:corrinoid methyltransferase-like protein
MAGAVTDFKAFVAWAQTHGIDQTRIASRREWITALEADQSPFDEAMLQALRDEVDDRRELNPSQR